MLKKTIIFLSLRSLKIFKWLGLSKKEYVWYASYGSNLSYNRFLCYIIGGSPDGDQDPYPGCEDKTLPIAKTTVTLKYELYFARSSTRWQNGGMGFIETNRNPNAYTYGYMYLITKEQFQDVVRQENGNIPVTLNFDEAIQNGFSVFQNRRAYRNLIFVGDNNDYPIFTFTFDTNTQQETQPSREYLTMIATGLVETYQLNQEQIVTYFLNKRGILGNYNRDQLFDLTNPLFNA